MEENIQTGILKILQSAKSGLQMEELSERLNLTRHTVAKYLEVLRAEGKIHYNKIGRTKLWTDVSAAVNIRFLGMDDLEDILAHSAENCRGSAIGELGKTGVVKRYDSLPP